MVSFFLLQVYKFDAIHVMSLKYLILGFNTPPNSDYNGYHNYINIHLPPESPYLYGLHPNAEIGFLTATSEKLFKTVFELQPRDSGGGGGMVTTR